MAKVKKHIQKMSPYKPPLEGRASKEYLLLDFNERTITPGPKVKEALKKFIDSERLQVYPEYGDLEEKIAQYAQVPNSQVIVTNGGDQGIDIICRAHLSESDKVIIPFPGFAMHYQSVGIQGAEILEPSYDEKTGIFPLEETLNLISNNGKIKLVILCNPNNPLGVSISIEDVEKILKKAKDYNPPTTSSHSSLRSERAPKEIVVLHDEAYFEFSGITCKDLIEKYDNLYIMRTFSKAFGLVASRVGYLISQEKNLQQLQKIRGPYDVNMFAKTAVLAALEDVNYMKEYVKEVTEKSKPMLENFLKERNINFFPSAANFLFLKVPRPKEIIEGLKKEGILVRPKKGPGNEDGVRVSIGTLEDTQKFIEAFNKVY